MAGIILISIHVVSSILAISMGLEERVKEYLKRVEFRNKIVLVLFTVFVIIFLAVWAIIGFALPEFLTDVRLVEKSGLFALWTIGAILFGVALATFIFSRELRNATRAK